MMKPETSIDLAEVTRADRHVARELNRNRVRLHGYLISATYYLVTPALLFGKVALTISPNQHGDTTFTAWANGDTKPIWNNLANGVPVEIETTLRKRWGTSLEGVNTVLINPA